MRHTLSQWIAIFLILMFAVVGGCGPLFHPMTILLPPDQQKTYDGMWDNMLTPANRVDRQTLLDVVMVYSMFQIGVDRLHMISEKYLSNGKVVMEIDCDRSNPLTDQFTITVLDERGRTVRRERYSRQDVEDTAKVLTEPPITVHGSVSTTEPCTQPATTEPVTTAPATTGPASKMETPGYRSSHLEFERRWSMITAATQPATLR